MRNHFVWAVTCLLLCVIPALNAQDVKYPPETEQIP